MSALFADSLCAEVEDGAFGADLVGAGRGRAPGLDSGWVGGGYRGIAGGLGLAGRAVAADEYGAVGEVDLDGDLVDGGGAGDVAGAEDAADRVD